MYLKNEKPSTIPGIRIGETNIPLIIPLPAKSNRLNAYAAGTPSNNARIFPAIETMIDVLKVLKNISTLKIFSYHLNEYSSGGNFKMLPPSKEVIEIISNGPSKKTKTRNVNRANPLFFSCIHLYPFGLSFFAAPFIMEMIIKVTTIMIVATIEASFQSFNVIAF